MVAYPANAGYGISYSTTPVKEFDILPEAGVSSVEQPQLHPFHVNFCVYWIDGLSSPWREEY